MNGRSGWLTVAIVVCVVAVVLYVLWMGGR